jgi:hypothetical protein
MVFNFLARQPRFCLLLLKTLNNAKDCSNSRIRFCSGFPSLSLVDFVEWAIIAGFGKNFQDHRQLPKQLLESQAATGSRNELSEEGYFSQLVSDFTEASGNFNILIFRTLKKFSSCDTVPLTST